MRLLRRALRVASAVSIAFLAGSLRAQSAIDLHDFTGLDGAAPNVPMVLGNDGLLYGVTLSGGANSCPGNECGTVFTIDPLGTLSTIYDFPETATDAYRPQAGLTLAADGLFYGTTQLGLADLSVGTVYRIDSQGTLTVLHNFAGGGDGAEPFSGLLQTSDGTLFGTTVHGGDVMQCSGFGCGTLFSLDGAGTLTPIHSFDFTDGAQPQGNLIVGADGEIWGTAPGGGIANVACGAGGCGTVFESTPSGDLSPVYSFTGADDGYHPGGTLLHASDGNVYGTTGLGGANGVGTVFRIDSAGMFTTIHTFDSTDGAYPVGGLMQAMDGTMFGTTSAGGDLFIGTIYKMDTAGNITTLYSFDPSVGQHPFTPLVQASDGNLYGTANGGTGGYGIVYQFPFQCFADVPLANPFYSYICKIGVHRVTGGCGGGNYCPNSSVTRAQMAVFLLKAKHGAGFVPPACAGIYADVPCPSPFADWIEDLAAEGITGGCGSGNYCPANPVTRAQMAVFLLKAKNGSGYTPPACAGVFTDVTCPSLFADWIEELALEQITGGCGGGNYCPGSANTRGQMAVFLVKTFGLN